MRDGTWKRQVTGESRLQASADEVVGITVILTVRRWEEDEVGRGGRSGGVLFKFLLLPEPCGDGGLPGQLGRKLRAPAPWRH